MKDDNELFLNLKDLFLEMFPELTKEEYLNQTDVGEILNTFGRILNKSTQFESDNPKNV